MKAKQNIGKKAKLHKVAVYAFQCPRCYLVSGFMSQSKCDAPTCCGGVKMVPYEIPTN